MITIQLLPDQKSDVTALVNAHPTELTLGETSGADGGGGPVLFLSFAALAVPAIQQIVIAWIRAKRYRSVTRSGIKYVGYSPEDIAKIEAVLDPNGK